MGKGVVVINSLTWTKIKLSFKLSWIEFFLHTILQIVHSLINFKQFTTIWFECHIPPTNMNLHSYVVGIIWDFQFLKFWVDNCFFFPIWYQTFFIDLIPIQASLLDAGWAHCVSNGFMIFKNALFSVSVCGVWIMPPCAKQSDHASGQDILFGKIRSSFLDSQTSLILPNPQPLYHWLKNCLHSRKLCSLLYCFTMSHMINNFFFQSKVPNG